MNWKQKLMIGAVVIGAAVVGVLDPNSRTAMVGLLGSISIAILMFSKKGGEK